MKKQTNIFDDMLRVANPHACAADPSHVMPMISGGNRNGLSGNADRMPMVYRAGSQDALQCPSRMGNKLFYRDGRVEAVA